MHVKVISHMFPFLVFFAQETILRLSTNAVPVEHSDYYFPGQGSSNYTNFIDQNRNMNSMYNASSSAVLSAIQNEMYTPRNWQTNQPKAGEISVLTPNGVVIQSIADWTGNPILQNHLSQIVEEGPTPWMDAQSQYKGEFPHESSSQINCRIPSREYRKEKAQKGGNSTFLFKIAKTSKSLFGGFKPSSQTDQEHEIDEDFQADVYFPPDGSKWSQSSRTLKSESTVGTASTLLSRSSRGPGSNGSGIPINNGSFRSGLMPAQVMNPIQNGSFRAYSPSVSMLHQGNDFVSSSKSHVTFLTSDAQQGTNPVSIGAARHGAAWATHQTFPQAGTAPLGYQLPSPVAYQPQSGENNVYMNVGQNLQSFGVLLPGQGFYMQQARPDSQQHSFR